MSDYNAVFSLMSPPKPNEPAEVMRDTTSQLESFEIKLVEGSGYFTWPDVEKHRKEFGGSRITACGVTYEYGTHPLAALAMRERAAVMIETHVVENQFDGSRVVVPSPLAKEDQHHRSLAKQLRALPTTFTNAELLAAAMQLPEVRALVDALVEYKRRARNVPFNLAVSSDAAIALFTKGGE